MRGVAIGDTYSLLKVRKDSGLRKGKYILWDCDCDCGNRTRAISTSLKNGTKKSCGCLGRKIQALAATTHGLSKSRFYRVWKGMLERVNKDYNPRHDFYAKRGVVIEWPSFVEFKNDMYEAYLKHVEEFGEKNTSIDRINNEGHYCKENCHWATAKEQANNRSNNLNYAKS